VKDKITVKQRQSPPDHGSARRDIFPVGRKRSKRCTVAVDAHRAYQIARWRCRFSGNYIRPRSVAVATGRRGRYNALS